MGVVTGGTWGWSEGKRGWGHNTCKIVQMKWNSHHHSNHLSVKNREQL